MHKKSENSEEGFPCILSKRKERKVPEERKYQKSISEYFANGDYVSKVLPTTSMKILT